MMTNNKKKNLVIIGDSAFAEVAFEYFTCDSDYRVVGFAVEREHITRTELLGLPVIAAEDMTSHFPPDECDVYVAIVYSQLNRLRTRLYNWAKSLGYAFASYVSSQASVWRNVTLGEHCFILENNVIQPFVTIGRNVVMWSGNHLGHHSAIRDNAFISSHVVISGYCDIGQNCFLGVNSTFADRVTIGDDCWIGPGVVVSTDIADSQLLRATKTEPSKITATRFFKIKPKELK